MNPNQKVQFKGIEGMLFKPCETTVFKKNVFYSWSTMVLIEHAEGQYYPDHGKNLLFVNINDHLTIL